MKKLYNYNVESFYIPIFKRPYRVNVKTGLELKKGIMFMGYKIHTRDDLENL